MRIVKSCDKICDFAKKYVFFFSLKNPTHVAILMTIQDMYFSYYLDKFKMIIDTL